ncbi:MAG: hypothetical protein JNK26_01080 [Candidatus Doudnabacteria bacterium]|nr:hypothetical protein [Candidatus Doudnabacteria bacterium]
MDRASTDIYSEKFIRAITVGFSPQDDPREIIEDLRQLFFAINHYRVSYSFWELNLDEQDSANLLKALIEEIFPDTRSPRLSSHYLEYLAVSFAKVFGLTPREAEIIVEISRRVKCRKSIKNAAMQTHFRITESTLKDHLGNIYRKLEARDPAGPSFTKTDLATIARQWFIGES